jgi:hypothetical protein
MLSKYQQGHCLLVNANVSVTLLRVSRGKGQDELDALVARSAATESVVEGFVGVVDCE